MSGFINEPTTNEHQLLPALLTV